MNPPCVRKQVDLFGDFEKAVDDGSSDGGGKGSTEGQPPKLKLNAKVRCCGRKRKGKDKD